VLEKAGVTNEDRRSPLRSAAVARVSWKRFFLPTLLLILSAGIVLRIYPSAAFKGVGFDEGLYKGYVTALVEHGMTSYPDISEQYVAIQSRLPSAILPPTRFLYIFAAYLWHQCFGSEALASLHAISIVFSILLLLLSTLFAWRLGGRAIALGVAALMACAPTQIHMSQHALIDGFFAFWALLCLWLLWENLRHPDNPRWLIPYAFALALLVLTKENAFFAFFALVVLLAANHWLRFGSITRTLLAMTLVGPLIGVAILVNLCGSLETTYQIYLLLVRKASVLPYAIATGDGPWYRYLVDLMLVSPTILVLAIGAAFLVRRSDTAALYLLIFVAASYAVMANVRYGMNLRYTNMWDMPLRYLSVLGLMRLGSGLNRFPQVWPALAVVTVCLLELHQYQVLFVKAPLYELVTEGLLRAVHILK